MTQRRPKFSLGTAENQILFILVSAFVVLLAASLIYQLSQNRSAEEWARTESTGKTVAVRLFHLDLMRPEEMQGYVDAASYCSEGFTVTPQPYAPPTDTEKTRAIQRFIATSLEETSGFMSLGKSMEDISVANATFSESDFSFDKCAPDRFDLPMEGIVISARLDNGQWFNLAVTERKFKWDAASVFSAMRFNLFFLGVGIIALLFIRRLTQPLSRLTKAVSRFGTNLEVQDVEESGPEDIRNAILRFNTMQREVRDEVKRRTQMLAAVGHDIRTPLTALRVKAELIENDEARDDIIAGIEKMERITASALDYVRGESRSESKQYVDLRALIESECSEFEELGHHVYFKCASDVNYHCRPIAMSRAIRNLIDNAVKYAGNADVELRIADECIEISVRDTGPGIPEHQRTEVLDPFTRLSKARESEKGGLGLGLSITKAIIDGHDGALKLYANEPNGLKVVIRLPFPRGTE